MLRALYRTLFAAAFCGAAMTAPPASAVDPSLLDGLEYRLVGPWRGGRVTAVTGVPGNPQRGYAMHNQFQYYEIWTSPGKVSNVVTDTRQGW